MKLNLLTLKTLLNSARGEEIHKARDAQDLFDRLDIPGAGSRVASKDKG